MMPVNNNYSTNPWPGCGEIDIMEEVGVDANIVSSSIHCAAYNHTINTQKTASRNIGTAESEFHVYACEWTPDYLKFFVDGTELMTFKNEGSGKMCGRSLMLSILFSTLHGAVIGEDTKV